MNWGSNMSEDESVIQLVVGGVIMGRGVMAAR